MREREGRDGYLLERLGGGLDLLYVRDGKRPQAPPGVRLTVIGEDRIDHTGLFAERFSAAPRFDLSAARPASVRAGGPDDASQRFAHRALN
jgi:hypothetical protein